MVFFSIKEQENRCYALKDGWLHKLIRCQQNKEILGSSVNVPVAYKWLGQTAPIRGISVSMKKNPDKSQKIWEY